MRKATIKKNASLNSRLRKPAKTRRKLPPASTRSRRSAAAASELRITIITAHKFTARHIGGAPVDREAVGYIRTSQAGRQTATRSLGNCSNTRHVYAALQARHSGKKTNKQKTNNRPAKLQTQVRGLHEQTRVQSEQPAHFKARAGFREPPLLSCYTRVAAGVIFCHLFFFKFLSGEARCSWLFLVLLSVPYFIFIFALSVSLSRVLPVISLP